MSKKSKAFELFSQGFRPSAPEVKSLGLKPKSSYNYFQEWKKSAAILTPQNGGNKQAKAASEGSQVTNNPSAATLIKFIPQVVTCPLTPLMLVAKEAAIREWGWRPDMPWENFFDTCLYLYFEACGITLQGCIINAQIEDAESEKGK